MNNCAKYLGICAIFAREQVCRRRLHAGIQGRVNTLMSGLNNHCDLTWTTWRAECHIWPAEATITATGGTPLKCSEVILSLRAF